MAELLREESESEKIDAERERKLLSLVRDFKRKMVTVLGEERKALELRIDEEVAARRQQQEKDPETANKISALSSDLSSIRDGVNALKMLTSFREEDLVLCTVCLSNPRAVN